MDLGMQDKKNWFRVEAFVEGEYFTYYGNTPYETEELARRLTAGEWVTLDDLVYYDDQDRLLSWTEWDPQCQPRVVLNPRHVLYAIPLVDDPRRSPDGGGRILRLPNASRPGPEGGE